MYPRGTSRRGNGIKPMQHTIFNITAYFLFLSDTFSLLEDIACLVFCHILAIAGEHAVVLQVHGQHAPRRPKPIEQKSITQANRQINKVSECHLKE